MKRQLSRAVTVSKKTKPSRKQRGQLSKLENPVKYNVHSYKRFATPLLFQALQPTSAYNNVITFDLSQVRNPTELTALYDQYMIERVKCVFKLVSNPDSNNALVSNVNPNSANFYPTLLYSRDYDNNTVETALELRERNTTKMAVLKPNEFISISVRPAVRSQIYLDGVTTASSCVWNQWLDCSVSNVPHYGLKFSVDMNGVTTAQDFFIRVEMIYFLKFKNAR